MALDPLASLLSPYRSAAAGSPTDFMNDPIYSLLMPQEKNNPTDPLGARPGSGPGGSTLAQLRQGFLDAGRPDLAKMVGTGAFDTWIGAESGWDPNAVSPANNQGQKNGGLFQFWYGHDFSNSAEGANSFNASPYQQAIWAAKNFSLDPGDIRGYARQIRSGSYPGWG